MIMTEMTLTFCVLSLSSLVLSAIAILCMPLHLRWTGDEPDKIQGVHSHVVPRIGGLCVMLSVLGATIFFADGSPIVGSLLISAVPVVLFGLAEDAKIRVSPAIRLVAAAFSGVLAIYVFDVWLIRVDVPFFDEWLHFAAFGIVFSIIASTTLCHAYNLIDGLNGLSSGIFIIAMANIALITWTDDGDAIAVSASFLVFATVGFWVVNFVTGRIFLGDGGAYFFGHAVAWMSILTAVYHPTVSPWALLLNTIIPVTDTLMAILRRYQNRKNFASADREHLHHILYAVIEHTAKERLSQHWQNGVASCLVLLLAGLLSLAAWALQHSSSKSSIACIIAMVLIVAVVHIGKSVARS